MEKHKKNYTTLFKEFFESEKTGGFILIACTVISILIANSFLSESYLNFWQTKIDLSFLSIHLDFSLSAWINDGLMVIFFLLVGLEIERELYIGELSNTRKAILPVGAAIGGMLVPGLLHLLLNANSPTQGGFAIPMATDIAFAIGILSLAGKSVPVSVKIFLTALAIIDDLGAIIIIAIFYTDQLNFLYLSAALAIFALLIIFNRFKIYRLAFYLLPGIAMWYCMHESGIHATIAGVMLAFAVPFKKIDEENPSYKLQHLLHKPVAFLIIPLFALANTAIVLPENLADSLSNNNSLGILAGLCIGKVMGVFLFTYLLVKSGLGVLYEGITWNYLLGAGLLAGIGFTMSIFITNLAFTSEELITSSKLSILLASLVSATAGLIVLKRVAAKNSLRS